MAMDNTICFLAYVPKGKLETSYAIYEFDTKKFTSFHKTTNKGLDNLRQNDLEPFLCMSRHKHISKLILKFHKALPYSYNTQYSKPHMFYMYTFSFAQG